MYNKKKCQNYAEEVSKADLSKSNVKSRKMDTTERSLMEPPSSPLLKNPPLYKLHY